MKKIFTLLFCTIISANLMAQFPTIYATLSSGNWNSTAVWETFTGNATNTPGTLGTGTAATTTPSGTHYVYIRSGHTVSMNAANRSCIGLTVEATGKLWANETAARRLQIANGGTGFTFPQSWPVVNNGTIGGAGDGLFYEPGTNAATITQSGSGSCNIGRIRMPGGLGNRVLGFTVDQDMTLNQTANYALSAVYSGTNVLDVYTFTINAGRTVTISAADGYFHSNNATGTGGSYTYNINGTLDVSANTQTMNNISSNLGPLQNVESSITLNVNGIFKVGSALATTSNSGGLGTLNLNIGASGLVDATNTTTLNIILPYYFKVTGNGTFRRTVNNTDVLFPIGVGSSYNPAIINNAGTADVMNVTVKNTLDNAVSDATKIVTKQWTIGEVVAGGSDATVKLGWVVADQASGFNPASATVIARWNGSAWITAPATVTGTGTVTDPYIATASGFSAFGNFIVANTSALPVVFSGAKAFQKNTGIQVEWSVASEINTENYIVEKSINGNNFTASATIASKGNSTTTVNYSWFDAAPNQGVNFYRIKSVDKDGAIKYTAVLKVNIGKSRADMVIAPNPVKGKDFSLQLAGLEKGTYSVQLFNQLGQQILNKSIVTDGGTISQTIALNPSVTSGVYTLRLIGNNAQLSKKLVVE